jgi:hypothetical protein
LRPVDRDGGGFEEHEGSPVMQPIAAWNNPSAATRAEVGDPSIGMRTVRTCARKQEPLAREAAPDPCSQVPWASSWQWHRAPQHRHAALSRGGTDAAGQRRVRSPWYVARGTLHDRTFARGTSHAGLRAIVKRVPSARSGLRTAHDEAIRSRGRGSSVLRGEDQCRRTTGRFAGRCWFPGFAGFFPPIELSSRRISE